MKITKAELSNLIHESTHEVGEMAQKPMGEAQFRPIYHILATGEIVIGEKKFLEQFSASEKRKIGDLLNDKIALVFTCDDKDFDTFFARNPGIVEQLESQFGENVGFTNKIMPCSKFRHKPIKVIRSDTYGRSEFLTPDTTQGLPKTSRKARTWILNGGNFSNTGEHQTDKNIEIGVNKTFKRGIYKLIDSFFEKSDVVNHLTLCGIPDIKSGDENREFLNRHGEISNDKIEYASLNYHLYDTADEFVNSVIERSTSGGDILTLASKLENRFIEASLARQYNKERPNWDPAKMSKAEYLGKTEIYKLNRYGLQEMNPEITVRSEFKINGLLNESSNTYIWNVEFITLFGEKLKSQFYLGKFSVDKDFKVTRNIKYKPYHKFDDEHPVLFNPDIYAGLVDALKEMKEKILSIEPLSILDLVKAKPDLAENEIEKVVRNMLSKIK